MGLLRQPVGKWRSLPATGARAKITSFYTGEDGATTVKLAVIVTEGDDEAAIEMPIPEFLSSYPAGAGAEGDAADAGAGDAEPEYRTLDKHLAVEGAADLEHLPLPMRRRSSKSSSERAV